MNAHSSLPQVSLTHEYYRLLTSTPPPWTSRRKKVRKIDAHVSKKNITSAKKQQSWAVNGGFVSFTNHFKYLESYISYSLQDDYEINTCLAAGNLSMVALAKLWTDASNENHSKYLVFLVVPINILLWGCDRWVLRTSLPKKNWGIPTFPHLAHTRHQYG